MILSQSCGTEEEPCITRWVFGDAGVDLLDALDGQDVAGRGTGELVGAVAGADGDGQRVDAGLLDEVAASSGSVSSWE
jgi:hypothetical protein